MGRPRWPFRPNRNSRRRPRRTFFETLEPRLVLASLWQNPCNPLDVTNDGQVSPIDALLPVNQINEVGAGPLPVPPPAESPPPFFDTTGDQQLAPLDVLVVINALNGLTNEPFLRFDGTLIQDTAIAGTTNNDGITSDARVGGVMTALLGLSSLQARVDGGAPIAVPQTCGSFTFDPGLRRDGSQDGPHTVSFTGRDAQDREATFDVEFTLDTQAPSLTLALDPLSDTAPVGDGITESETIGLTGQTDANVTVQLIQTATETTASAAGEFSFPDLALSEALQEFDVRVSDAAGNETATRTYVSRKLCGLNGGQSDWVDRAFGGSTGGGGSVERAACQAVLREGDSFSVTLQRPLTVPSIPAQLAFQVVTADFDLSDSAAIHDAFEAAYLTADGTPLALPIAAQRDAFFNLTEQQPPALGTGGGVDLPTVRLDLTQVPAGSAGTLVFRLVNNDADKATSVTIGDVVVLPSAVSPPVKMTASTNQVNGLGLGGVPGIQAENDGVGGEPSGTAAIGGETFAGLSLGVPPLRADARPSSGGNSDSRGVAPTAATDSGPPNPLVTGHLASTESPAGVLIARQLNATGASMDNRGTDFWLGFADNLLEGGRLATKSLFIAGDVATTGTVSVPGLNFSQEFAVNPGEVTTVVLPTAVEVETVAQIEAKGIHVVAQDDVTVYGLNQATFTTDAFLGLPIDALGTEYVNLTYKNTSRLTAYVAGTQLLIVGAEDGTSVTIAPGAESLPTNNSKVTLVNPSNQNATVINNGLDSITEVLDRAGEYTLTVSPPLPAYAGTYQFRLLDLETNSTALPMGDTVRTTLPTGRETVVYRFDATIGQRVVLDSLSQSNQATMRLVTPSNAITTLNLSQDYRGTITETGTHFIVVSGNATGAVDVALRLLDLNTAAPLPLETPITGTLATGRETTMYQLHGMAGQSLRFDGLDANRGSTTRFIGPGGNQIATVNSADDSLVVLPETADYLVFVEGSGNGATPYAFQLLDVDAFPSLALGATHSGTLASGETAGFRFQAVAGQKLAYDLLSLSAQASVSLYRPDGSRLFGATAAVDSNLISLDTTGQYEFVMQAIHGGAGDFNFRLLDAGAGAAITDESVQTGTLGPMESIVFRVPQSAGERRVYDGQGEDFENVVVQTFGTNGDLIESRNADADGDVLSAEMPGTGYLVVRNNLTTASDFRFRLLDASAAPALTLNAAVTGDLPLGREMTVFQFTGQVGQRLLFDALESDADAINVRLLGPGNTSVFQASSNSDANPVTLTETGGYTLLIVGNTNGPADFNFRVLDIAAAPVLSFDGVENVSLTPSAARQVYRFQGSPAEQVLFDSLSAPANPGNWTLFGPDNSDVSSRAMTNDFSATLLTEGEYLLVIPGNGVGASFDMSFQATRMVDAPVPPTGFGSSQTLTIGAGQTARYSFTGPAGRVVYLDSLDTQLNNLRVAVESHSGQEIFGANDVNDQGPFLLPASGTYTVVLRGLNATQSGSTTFRLLDLAAAPLLDLDTTVADTSDRALGTQAYRFPAAVGDRLYYNGLDADSDNVSAQIVAPSAERLFLTNSDNEQFTGTLAESGEHYLLIHNNLTTTPDFRFRLLDVDSAPLLPLDSQVTATLDPGTQVTAFRFDGTMGQRLFFDGAESDLDNVTAQLRGPGGSQVFSINSDNDFGPFTITEAGTYQLFLIGNVGAPTNFVFRMLDVAQPDEIDMGTTVSGSLGPFGAETAVFQFPGGAGQQILFDALDTDNDNVTVRIWGPGGEPLLSANANLDSSILTLGQPGTYTLYVQGVGTANADFAFRLLDLASAAPLALDARMTGNLPTGRDAALLRFEGTSGQRLYYNGLDTDNDPIILEVYDASFNRVFLRNNSDDDGEMVLGETGTHYVFLRGNGNAASEYRFELRDVSAPPQITYGTQVTGTLDTGRSHVVFQFSGSAGQHIYYDGLDTDNDAISARILGPGGDFLKIFNSDDDSDILSLVDSGRHTLIIEASVAAPADYRFRLLDADAAPLLAFGETISDTLNPGRATQLYRILGEAGETLSFDNLTATPLNAAWSLVDPGNHSLGGHAINTDFSATALASGQYFLALDGNNNTSAVAYSFRADRTAPVDSPLVGFGVDQTASIPISGGASFSFTAPAGRIVYLDVLKSDFRIPVHTVTLDAGDTYQIRDENGTNDLTGTVVTSDKPVAMYGSHLCTFIPNGYFACDHLVEQLPPTEAWGREFVTAPLATRTKGDTFRFLAATDGTTVHVNGRIVATLNRGEFHEQILTEPSEIQSNHPLLVAQYSNSTGFDGVTSDPFMVIVPPIEQFLANYTVTTPATGFDTNFVNMLAPAAAVGQIEVDGAKVGADQYVRVGETDFYESQVPVSLGSHSLAGPMPFGVFVYGYAAFDSYGYTGGQSLAPVARTTVIELTPPTARPTVGTPLEFSARVLDDLGRPLEGVRVDFLVSGVNPQQGFAFSDATGAARFTYAGVDAGRDVVTASVGKILDDAIVDWREPAAAPTISVNSPTSGRGIAAGTTIVASGVALADWPDAALDLVSVNGVPVDALDAAGNFFVSLLVAPGENTYQFVATDSLDQTAIATLTIVGTEPRAGEVDFSQFADVTGSFRVDYARTSYHADRRTLFADVAVRNAGQYPADVPLLVGITNLSDPRVLVRDADGQTPDGIPYYDFTGLVTGGTLAPRGQTGFLSAAFYNPSQDHFTYDLVFLGRLNQPPQLSSIPPLEANQGRAYTYDVDATDPEGDTLAFSLTQGPAGMIIASDSGLITWTPQAADLGTQDIEVQVSDGRGGIAQQRYALATIVAPPNRPPVFTSLPAAAAHVGALYSYDASAVDPDGDSVGFALSTAPQGMTVDPPTGLVTWTPRTDQAGDQRVVLEASDGHGNAARQAFTVCTVEAVGNHAPVITSQPLTAASPGTYTYDVAAVDPDGDTLAFSLSAAPAGMTIASATGLISWTPTAADVGSYDVVVQVADGRGAFGQQSLVLTIVANEAPSITGTPVTSANVGQAYSYDVDATDGDGDPLVFSLIDGPPGMTIDVTSGLINWQPDGRAFERESVRVQVSDGRGGIAAREFLVNVVGGQSLENNPSPLFTSSPPSTAMVGRTLVYRAAARDPNGDPLSFDLPLAPTGMSVDAATGVVVWEPAEGQVGSHQVVLRVQDDRRGVWLQTFELEVAPANVPPVVTSSPGRQAVVGQPFEYRVLAQDADGDPLGFTLMSPLDGMTVRSLANDEATAVIEWTPAAAGTFTVSLVVQDGQGGQTQQAFSLEVADSATNMPPVITSTPRGTIPLGRTWVYLVEATDANSDPLSFSLAAAPTGMALDAQLRAITWTPTDNQLGSQLVTLRVADGRGGAATQEFSIAVTSDDFEQPPAIVSTPPASSVPAGDVLAYDLRATDPDGDPVEWSLVEAPHGVSLDSRHGTLRWSPTQAQLGVQRVAVRAADPAGGSVIQSFSVLVSCADLPPTIASRAATDAATGERYVYGVRAIDPEGKPLHFELTAAPNGMTIDAQRGVIRWTPGNSQLGTAAATVQVTDAAGNAASQSFAIEVRLVVRNQDPVITSRPAFRATVGEGYTYDVEAFDPEGGALTFALVSAPQGMTIAADTGLINWTPIAGQAGGHLIVVAASDTAGSRGTQRFAILARVNQPPVITSQPVTTVSTGAVYRYDVQGADPEGDALAFALTKAPPGATIDDLGRIRWETGSGNAGRHDMEIQVTDSHGDSVKQAFTLEVTPDQVLPVVELLLSANPALLGSDVVVTVRATDDVGVAGTTLALDGQILTLDATGTATIRGAVAGLFNLVATASDEAGNLGTAQATLRVFDPADTQGPAIAITSPTAGSIVTTLTAIVGSVTDDNLEFYRVQYGRADLVDVNHPMADDPDWETIAESNSQAVDAVLATFDPTMLINDDYVIRVLAQDLSRNVSAKTLRLGLDGQLKLGQFALEFTDLTIPLAGIPIQVTRAYDSRNASEQGDFGFGWRLDVQDAQIRESIPVNPLELQGLAFAATPFREGTRVYLTNPEGRRVGFTFRAVPQFSLFGGGSFAPQFVPDPGVYDTLDVGTPPLRRVNGAFFDGFFGSPFNPAAYRLTTKEGVTYEIGQFSGLQNIIDRNGNRIHFTSDGVFSSVGESIEFIRDGQGRITQITDPNGNPLIYQYDAQGNLQSFTDQVGLTTSYTYLDDPAHFLDTIIDWKGRKALDAEFDSAGRLISTADALGGTVRQAFDTDHSLFTTTDARGNPTIFRHDNRGNVVEEKDALGHSTFYEYADPRNPDLETRIVDRNGHATSFTYDARGNVLTRTDAAGNTREFAYNVMNKLESETDELGRTTTTTYDRLGNPIKVIDAAGISHATSYDAQGRVSATTDGNGNTTTFIYDAACPCGAPGIVVNPDGSTRRFEYNAFGQVVKLTDEAGKEFLVEYDDVGRQTRTLGPNGQDSVFMHDGELLIEQRGWLDATTIAITRFAYDSRNRLVRQTNSENGVAEFAYDENGNVTLVRDPVGNETRYRYDSLNRPIERTDALSHSALLEYDLVGNVAAYVDRDGRRREFVYDPLDRLVEERWLDGGVPIYTIALAYDAVGNLTQASNPGSKLAFIYDALDRVTLAYSVGGLGQPRLTLGYQYDAVGNVTSVRDNTGVEVRSEYDNRRRLAVRTWQGLPIDQARFEADYDARGDRVAIRRFADVAGTDAVGHSLFEYDDSSRLTGVRHLAAALLADYDYTYDRLDRLIRESHHGDIANYTYDLTGQLLSVDHTLLPDESYEYDANGNRSRSHLQGTDYVTGVDNRLLTDGEFNYEYDNEGRLVKTTEIGTGIVTTLSYDHRGRLTSLVSRSAAGVIINDAQYAYDALDRRVAETVNGETVFFGHNGDAIWVEFDATGNVIARYLDGATIDEHIARYRPAEGTTWYLVDGLRTVRDIADDRGALLNHVDYDAFGAVVSQSNISAQDRYMFTGREKERASTWYYYRARLYDPRAGRFLSQDPIGLAADLNPYRYVMNSPLNYSDPFGLTAIPSAAAAQNAPEPGKRTLAHWGKCIVRVLDETLDKGGGDALGIQTVPGGYVALAEYVVNWSLVLISVLGCRRTKVDLPEYHRPPAPPPWIKAPHPGPAPPRMPPPRPYPLSPGRGPRSGGGRGPR